MFCDNLLTFERRLLLLKAAPAVKSIANGPRSQNGPRSPTRRCDRSLAPSTEQHATAPYPAPTNVCGRVTTTLRKDRILLRIYRRHASSANTYAPRPAAFKPADHESCAAVDYAILGRSLTRRQFPGRSEKKQSAAELLPVPDEKAEM